MSRRLFICSAGHIFFTSGDLPTECPRKLVYLKTGVFGNISKNKDGTDKIDKEYVCSSDEVYELSARLVTDGSV